MKWRVPSQDVDQTKLAEIVKKDCQTRRLNREDAVDRGGWKRQIRDD